MLNTTSNLTISKNNKTPFELNSDQIANVVSSLNIDNNAVESVTFTLTNNQQKDNAQTAIFSVSLVLKGDYKFTNVNLDLLPQKDSLSANISNGNTLTISNLTSNIQLVETNNISNEIIDSAISSIEGKFVLGSAIEESGANEALYNEIKGKLATVEGSTLVVSSPTSFGVGNNPIVTITITLPKGQKYDGIVSGKYELSNNNQTLTLKSIVLTKVTTIQNIDLNDENVNKVIDGIEKLSDGLPNGTTVTKPYEIKDVELTSLASQLDLTNMLKSATLTLQEPSSETGLCEATLQFTTNENVFVNNTLTNKLSINGATIGITTQGNSSIVALSKIQTQISVAKSQLAQPKLHANKKQVVQGADTTTINVTNSNELKQNLGTRWSVEYKWYIDTSSEGQFSTEITSGQGEYTIDPETGSLTIKNLSTNTWYVCKVILKYKGKDQDVQTMQSDPIEIQMKNVEVNTPTITVENQLGTNTIYKGDSLTLKATQNSVKDDQKNGIIYEWTITNGSEPQTQTGNSISINDIQNEATISCVAKQYENNVLIGTSQPFSTKLIPQDIPTISLDELTSNVSDNQVEYDGNATLTATSKIGDQTKLNGFTVKYKWNSRELVEENTFPIQNIKDNTIDVKPFYLEGINQLVNLKKKI